MRIFFATDIHGSEICWKKFLNAGKFYQAEAIVLGGDMTGKALVPILDKGNGRWDATLLEQRFTLDGEEQVREMEKSVKSRGYYPFRTTADELAELSADEARLDERFNREMERTVEEWMELAGERLRGTGIQCFVCPGNDDMASIDEIVRRSPAVTLAEGRVVEVGRDFKMISTGWANRTPWHTFREEDEPDLARRIEAMTRQLNDFRTAIFSLHCPPYGSGLDEAAELDENLQPKFAGRSIIPVGSTAVRDAIERCQPVLSLHGHIHEGKGAVRMGKTVVINPGSMYEQGVLLGALIDLDKKKGVKNYILTSG